MSASRYRTDPTTRMRKQTARAVYRIRTEMKKGNIAYSTAILAEGQRLDQIAHRHYGDGRLWWVIAAASNIGWSLQCPPGTSLRIPTNLSDIMSLT
jgi:nucleoid-associated protein YgaU